MSKKISDFTAITAIVDAAIFEVVNAAATWKGSFAQVKTWIKAWIVKGDVGLGNADNTSDANKPVSTAQAAAIALKANLASPALTGVPLAPTAALGTNTDQIATMAAIVNAVADLIHSAPGAMDTLKELADALGDDPNYAATITGLLALKAPLASPGLTGIPTAPTASVGTNTTQIATMAAIIAAIAPLLVDSTFIVADNSDATKKFKFQASGITTATTRELTVPDTDGVLAVLAAISQTFLGDITFSGHIQAKYGFQPATWPMKKMLGAGLARLSNLARGAGTSQVVTANRLYVTPIVIPYDFTAVEIAIRVAAFVTGNVRLGLYYDSGGNPGLLLADCGTVDTNSNALRAITISQALKAGVVWAVAVFDAGPTVVCNTTPNSGNGYSSGSSSLGPAFSYYRAFTYGALPSDESASTYTLTTATADACPCITIG